MTAQFTEQLRYKDENYSMCSNPLSDYFSLAEISPNFNSPHTALWRGYLGQWEIIDERLYIVNLSGILKDGERATLATIFPGFPERVFAHWFSGELRLPQGELIKYLHMGYGSTYEFDLFLQFENGVLKSTHTIDNRIVEEANPDDWFDFTNFTYPEAFSVKPENLVEQLTLKDIEEIETITDPLTAVPDKPFGYLNNAWLRFINKSRIGDELWSFSAKEIAPMFLYTYRKGYVLVRDKLPLHFFITNSILSK